MISTSTRVRSEAIPVWHFLPADWRLRFGPRTLVTPGLVLAEDRPLQMCEVGLHGARRAIDAFIYSPGPVVSHCLIWGDVIEDDDNLCGSRREHVAMADATPA